MKQKRFYSRVLMFLKQLLIPQTASGRIATLAALVGTWFISVYIVTTMYLSGFEGIVAGSLVALVAVILSSLVAVVLYGLSKLFFARGVRGVFALMIGLILALWVFGYPAMMIALIFLAVVPLLTAIGALIGHIMSQSFKTTSLIRKIASFCLLFSLLGISIAAVVWYQHEGTTNHLVKQEESPSLLVPSSMPNPANRGPYAVKTLTYGSGKDKHRSEYGSQVTLTTQAVDVTPFLPEMSSFRLNLRERFWGFNFSASPLNGRVWYPEGEDSFPLVVIVHGNHEMTNFSDSGYAYLGELLASRGYIAVSIDQNFLNGSMFGGDFGGEENAARAWHLLNHLQLWRAWQEDDTHLFYNKVDLDNIALIGHSRGGEAVAIAAAFNELSFYPDDATIPFDFNFGIVSLVAIAPTDEFYTPADRSVVLKDINYLLLQGGHDGDVSVFMGKRQYQRVAFSKEDYHFKSVVYIYQANHGQFNTNWGSRDLPAPFGKLLNVKSLLDGESQRQIAAVYIAAYLDTTLEQVTGYLPLFQNSGVGSEWLPEAIILNRFQDSTFRVVSDYEEDLDPATTTLLGGKQVGVGFTEWREGSLPFRMAGMEQANNVVFLGWEHDQNAEPPSYTITLPSDLDFPWSVNEEDRLTFSLVDLDHGTDPLQDLTLYVQDASGSRATLQLSDWANIIPPLPIQFTKAGFIERMMIDPVEPILQTYAIPLSAFAEANAVLDLEKLKEIGFIFEQEGRGRIALDEIGFSI